MRTVDEHLEIMGKITDMSITLQDLADMQRHLKAALDYLEDIEMTARLNPVIPGQATTIDGMRKTLHEYLQTADEKWHETLHAYTDALDAARRLERGVQDD